MVCAGARTGELRVRRRVLQGGCGWEASQVACRRNDAARASRRGRTWLVPESTIERSDKFACARGGTRREAQAGRAGRHRISERVGVGVRIRPRGVRGRRCSVGGERGRGSVSARARMRARHGRRGGTHLSAGGRSRSARSAWISASSASRSFCRASALSAARRRECCFWPLRFLSHLVCWVWALRSITTVSWSERVTRSRLASVREPRPLW